MEVINTQCTQTAHFYFLDSVSPVSAAVGLYVKSSEPLNVFANLLNNNCGTGITVLQSTQLTRLVTNCILENGRGGVTVEKDCRVELRGNGVYDNNGHGVSFSGHGQVVENDVVGNCGYGIQVSGCADIKVSDSKGRCTFQIHTHGNLLKYPCLTGAAQPRPTSTGLWHRRARPS